MASMSETCKHKKQAPREFLNSLPTAQAGTGRHKCAVCAYEAGIQEELRQAEIKQRLAEKKTGS